MNDKTDFLTVEERLFLAFCRIEKVAKKSLLKKYYDFFNEDNIYIMFKEIETVEKLSIKNKPKKLFRHIKKTLKKRPFFYLLSSRNCFEYNSA